MYFRHILTKLVFFRWFCPSWVLFLPLSKTIFCPIFLRKNERSCEGCESKKSELPGNARGSRAYEKIPPNKEASSPFSDQYTPITSNNNLKLALPLKSNPIENKERKHIIPINWQLGITEQSTHKEKSAVFCDFFSLWALILPYTDRGYHQRYTLSIGRTPSPTHLLSRQKPTQHIFKIAKEFPSHSVIRSWPDFIPSLSRLFLISLWCSVPHREQTRNKSQQENERGLEVLFSITNCTIMV